MATSDFRFRVSKAVGSPSVQGAASMETIANHTEDPHPHPQYMRKSYVGLEFDLTQHLARRLDHANNYALRDEITTTKLEYEKYKLISLAHDSSNYLSLTGVKPHLITSFVLNQILKDVGIDGSVKVLTYNNLINSYDTKVTDNTKYAPTWDIFLKLRNGIPSWIYGKNVGEFMLVSTFENWKVNVYNRFITESDDFKETWIAWVRYMYRKTEPETYRPTRAGLEVARYELENRISTPIVRPTNGYPKFAEPEPEQPDTKITVDTMTYEDILSAFVQTPDTSPVTGKTYYTLVSGAITETEVDLGVGFVEGVTYYELVKYTLTKRQGTFLTTGCSILGEISTREDPFYDWYNGQEWNHYAGSEANAEEDPWSPSLMIWEGNLQLDEGQTVYFSGNANTYWYCEINGTNISGNPSEKWMEMKNRTTNEYVHSYGDPACTRSYTATREGLHHFVLATCLIGGIGPKVDPDTAEASPTLVELPLKMSFDNETYVPISNESFDDPIFFIRPREDLEKTWWYHYDLRDRHPCRCKRKQESDLLPGLEIAQYELPERVTQWLFLAPESTNGRRCLINRRVLVPTTDQSDYNEFCYSWKLSSDTYVHAGKHYGLLVDGVVVEVADLSVGQQFPTGSTTYEKCYWSLTKTKGAFITSGCKLVENSCSEEEQTYYDWYNGQEWQMWSGNELTPDQDPWSPILTVWEGRIQLTKGDTVHFRGYVDDYWYCKIDDTVITDGDTLDWMDYAAESARDPSSYADLSDFTFTAPKSKLFNFTFAVLNVRTYSAKPSWASSQNQSMSNLPLKMSFDGVNFYSIDNESFGHPIFFLREKGDDLVKFWWYHHDLRDKFACRCKKVRRPGLLCKMWNADVWKSKFKPNHGRYNLFYYRPEHIQTAKDLTWDAQNFKGMGYLHVCNDGVAASTEKFEEGITYYKYDESVSIPVWDPSNDDADAERSTTAGHYVLMEPANSDDYTAAGASHNKYKIGNSISTTIASARPVCKYLERTFRTLVGARVTDGCSMLYWNASRERQCFFDWYNGTDWPYYAGSPDISTGDSSWNPTNDPFSPRIVGWFGTIFLRAGEIVSFVGTIDDQAWIKIGDVWVIDGIRYTEFVSGAQMFTNIKNTVHWFRATKTGYYPFKLLLKNIMTVGPGSGIRMSFNVKPPATTAISGAYIGNYEELANESNWVIISNTSFVKPRFFLPDDCDHSLFWEQALNFRARKSSGIPVMSSNPDHYRWYVANNEAHAYYATLSANNKTYNSLIIEFKVGYTWNGTNAWIPDSDEKWNHRYDGSVPVTIDVGASSTSGYYWTINSQKMTNNAITGSTFDAFLYIWTPDDKKAYVPVSNNKFPAVCRPEEDPNPDSHAYLGLFTSLQHAMLTSSNWYVAVHHLTVFVPFGSMITCVFGTTDGSDMADTVIPWLCHGQCKAHFKHVREN